ncbi:uncharacterized protein SETTUDRAFT_166677 [Exserohilum turcica Et28A]|uniref:Uncharacterized protein n=1 Tax=Exserohilum turcicum (strain 28A) TaxID=671987 RepID=R0KNX7_EXST2|nr:uncharacterized protein SETTUDRAFT_166677 [Exserohilum turcica Et28A]EOA90779.1 hypothetical protein SETTUDRAFT_166677 [Exserohilum turcica Et28A]
MYKSDMTIPVKQYSEISTIMQHLSMAIAAGADEANSQPDAQQHTTRQCARFHFPVCSRAEGRQCRTMCLVIGAAVGR